MAETYKTDSTYPAATRAMAGCLLSIWYFNDYGENQAMISQRLPSKTIYCSTVSTVNEEPTKTQVRLRIPQTRKESQSFKISWPETQDLIKRDAADFVSDLKPNNAPFGKQKK